MNFDERVVVTEIEKVGRRDSGKYRWNLSMAL